MSCFELDGIRITDDIEEILRYLDTREIIGHKVGNPGRRRKPFLLDAVTAFDIETTTLDLPEGPQAIMYHWQWAFGRDLVLTGRTWDEFQKCTARLDDYLETRNERLQLVVYDFNLSFEFQFLKGIYEFRDPKDVFVMDSRKILRCQIGRLDFRCAWIHSNMNLDTFCRKMGCTLRKQVGSLDYKVKRYPWTELSEDELRYCIYDVAALVEAIEREMEMDGDTLETIPLTSTGYVRRDAKAAIRSEPGWWHRLRPIQPDLELYQALREAFRGGNTHANRFYSGCILENVSSIDRSSSYPDVLVNHRFPMSEFVHRGPITLDRYHKNTEVHHKAYLIRVRFTDIELRDPYCGCPYLARDKCRSTAGGRFDNGRVLRASALETTCTDIDMRIIERQYTAAGIEILDSWSARYDYLPKAFRDLVNYYYKKKTELRGLTGEDAIFYDKMKNRLNALYGMAAQNVLKPEILFTSIEDYYLNENMDDEARLKRQAAKAFIPYQVGVWVTAWARWELDRAIRLADDNGQFVYTDTDSVKYVGELDITRYNETTMRRSFENEAHATDRNGNEHFMGVYEKDTEKPYKRFVTWGSKKYAYEDADGILHVTVSGVNKKIGAEELRRRGGLDVFQPGFVFRDAGGTESIYNDHVDFMWRLKGGGSESQITWSLKNPSIPLASPTSIQCCCGMAAS